MLSCTSHSLSQTIGLDRYYWSSLLPRTVSSTVSARWEAVIFAVGVFAAKWGAPSGFICALKTAAVSNCPNFSSFLSQVRSFRQPVYKLGAFDSLYRSVIEIAPYLCSPVFGVEICVIFQQSRFKRKSPISRKAFPCISNSLQNGQEFLSVTS